MKKNNYFGLITVLFLVIAVVFTNSCKKPEPCEALITVYDTTGTIPQPNVNVKLFATVTTSNGTAIGDLKAEGTTDSEGKVSFTIKLPAVLDIDCTIPNCTIQPPTFVNGVYVAGKYCHGKGIIKLEEGKTSEKKIYLRD